MSNIKKTTEDEENEYPKKKSYRKKSKSSFKFDMKKILRERQAESEIRRKNAEIDKEIKVINDLFQSEINKDIIDKDILTSISSIYGYIIFDQSKYNKFHKDIGDITNVPFQKLFQMSIEKDQLMASIHFNHLLSSKWSPELNDIQNILFNWGTDLDTLINKPLVKSQIKDDHKLIGRYNFELVINFITHTILNNNSFSHNDLLTLAKFAITIYLDHHCGQMINAIKTLFCTCIATAFHDDDETAIIIFAQEIYSRHLEKNLLKIVIDLFLPINSLVARKMYSYLTYKLFKSLLGKTNNISTFPSSIKDWFVQDLVNKDYFKQKPKVLSQIIQLLEHVVVTFNLYQEKEKLRNMYDFFHNILRPTALSNSQVITNILDMWKLQLFRLEINSVNVLY